MAVLISDVRYYGSADMPEADGSTVGGAIDFTKRVEFGAVANVSSSYDAVSSNPGDTGTNLTWMGRDSTGVVHSGTVTLNGTAKVNQAVALERLLAAVQTGGAIAGLPNPGGVGASGDVALMSHTLTVTGTFQGGCANATVTGAAVAQLQAGHGALVAAEQVLRVTSSSASGQIRRILAVGYGGLGSDYVAVDYNWGTVPSSAATYEVANGMVFEHAASSQGVALTGASTQVLAMARLFSTSSADVSGGAARTYYEKLFVNNNNAATALTSAQVEILSNGPALPAGAALDLALASGLADALTVANRQTAPASGSLVSAGTSGWVTQPAFVGVQSPGNLPASAGPANASGAVGLWARLSLAAGAAPYEGSPGATFRTQGTST